MPSEDPNNRRIGLIVVAVALVVGAALAVRFLAKSSTPEQSAPSGRALSNGMTSAAAERETSILSQEPSAVITNPWSAKPMQRSLLDRLASISADTIERQAELEKMAAEIPASETERTLNFIWGSADGPAHDLGEMLLRRWAGEQPALAAAWLSQKEDSPLKHQSALAIATVWANRKASDAANWVKQWPAEDRESGLVAVAYEAARNSPEDALRLAAEISGSETRDQLIRHAVSQWAAKDAETSIAWAAKMEPSPLRDQVVANVSLALSETDPNAAATLAIQSLPPGRAQNDVIVGIVQRWVQKDPERTAEWVGAFPESELRDTAMENLISLWSDKSPQGAADWLNHLEHGPTRDSAVAALTGKLASNSPTVAASWAESITDPDRRNLELERLAERWLATDNGAARNWIDSAPLSPESKARLLSGEPPKVEPPKAETPKAQK